jgi:hypothetical protein
VLFLGVFTIFKCLIDSTSVVSGFEKIACDACGCKRDAQEAKINAMEIESKALEASN